MPRLAKRFTMIGVDLRGVGGSTATPGGYDAAKAIGIGFWFFFFRFAVSLAFQFRSLVLRLSSNRDAVGLIGGTGHSMKSNGISKAPEAANPKKSFQGVP